MTSGQSLRGCVINGLSLTGACDARPVQDRDSPPAPGDVGAAADTALGIDQTAAHLGDWSRRGAAAQTGCASSSIMGRQAQVRMLANWRRTSLGRVARPWRGRVYPRNLEDAVLTPPAQQASAGLTARGGAIGHAQLGCQPTHDQDHSLGIVGSTNQAWPASLQRTCTLPGLSP